MTAKKAGRPLAGDRDAILADYQDGMSLRTIANKHRVSTSTVERYVSDANMTGIRRWPCKCKAGRVCAACVADIPLRGGRWVLDPKRLIQVWEAA